MTPATRLLERRREMIEVETGLSKQKEEFAMKMESITQRREELARYITFMIMYFTCLVKKINSKIR